MPGSFLVVKRNATSYYGVMGRPAKGGRAVQVRLPEALLAEVDEAVGELRAENELMSGITRSDVIRDAVKSAMQIRKANRKTRELANRPKRPAKVRELGNR